MALEKSTTDAGNEMAIVHRINHRTLVWTALIVGFATTAYAATRAPAKVVTHGDTQSTQSPQQGGGADSCSKAVATSVPVGPTGKPLSVTIHGDNTPASGPDCPAQAPDPLWWEAFTVDRCARVTISLCGTDPPQLPSYAILFDECPCGDRIRADASGRFGGICTDGNTWMVFDALQAGTYYYPVFSDEGVLLDGRGPYTITISAEGCLGVCCNPDAGTCVEDVAEGDCADPSDAWTPVGTCCEAECLRLGEEFASGNIQLLSRVPLEMFPGDPPRANDIWGYVSPRGREYAIVGLSVGTGIVDLTDPFNPVVIANVPDSTSIWSDIAVYDEFAYNVNEAGGGVQVIDLREIDHGVIDTIEPIFSTGIRTAHNIKVNADSGFAYACGTDTGSGGLIALDLSDPAHPQFAGAWTDHSVHDTYVVSYAHGPYAGREIAFNFCGAAGLRVVDVTDKSNMHTIGSGLYPTLTYAHQGWLDDDKQYLYANDELDELQNPAITTTTTYVFDVSQIIFPAYTTSFTNGVCASDHNLSVRGAFVYEANYTSGLRIYDVTDPMNAFEAGFFDTHPEGNEPGFDGAWGVYTGLPSGVVLVSDIQRGLFVVNFDCNNNGVPDRDDLTDGISIDCNANGLPDECEYLKLGDLDNNRYATANDQAAFVACMSGPARAAAASSYIAPCCIHADADADGDVDLKDLSLINTARGY